MVADTVTFRLYQLENAKSVWIVILRVTAEEHVEIHVFSDTLVTVKRMKLPSFVAFLPQFIKDYYSYYQNDNDCKDWNYNGESYCQGMLYRINTKIFFAGL